MTSADAVRVRAGNGPKFNHQPKVQYREYGGGHWSHEWWCSCGVGRVGFTSEDAAQADADQHRRDSNATDDFR